MGDGSQLSEEPLEIIPNNLVSLQICCLTQTDRHPYYVFLRDSCCLFPLPCYAPVKICKKCKVKEICEEKTSVFLIYSQRCNVVHFQHLQIV